MEAGHFSAAPTTVGTRYLEKIYLVCFIFGSYLFCMYCLYYSITYYSIINKCTLLNCCLEPACFIGVSATPSLLARSCAVLPPWPNFHPWVRKSPPPPKQKTPSVFRALRDAWSMIKSLFIRQAVNEYARPPPKK